MCGILPPLSVPPIPDALASSSLPLRLPSLSLPLSPVLYTQAGPSSHRHWSLLGPKPQNSTGRPQCPQYSTATSRIRSDRSTHGWAASSSSNPRPAAAAAAAADVDTTASTSSAAATARITTTGPAPSRIASRGGGRIVGAELQHRKLRHESLIKWQRKCEERRSLTGLAAAVRHRACRARAAASQMDDAGAYSCPAIGVRLRSLGQRLLLPRRGLPSSPIRSGRT